MDSAIKFYQQANDDLSTVRILCYLGNLEQAAQVCLNTRNKAACCHLARSYEMQGMYEEAVKIYVDATAYINAIRLCKVKLLTIVSNYKTEFKFIFYRSNSLTIIFGILLY